MTGQVIDEKNTKQFFPEALGSSNFIEKNGHISFIVVLKAVNLLIKRCSSIRICELILNICECLLGMPNIDHSLFFDEIIQIILRSFIWLGCPHGCNDGVQTPQADFLRIKARTLLSIIHRLNAESFSRMLVDNVESLNIQLLVDIMHSITGFCRADITVNAARRRSSSPRGASDKNLPSYRNHFNEKLKGIEGTIINVILKPAVSKLMRTMQELLQPENMSLYQDVRLFISFIQEQHGNPFRRVGLSALIDGRFIVPKLEAHTASIDILNPCKITLVHVLETNKPKNIK
ncbi:unnamed protein product [Dracunculus medinensis]|uniref:Uncharacterized protein n=1 Tax=Dracunculus medinensis TaxID=318479 RepID=A0A158Q549_DRAME|nr:unnamed protein product [Dracunculus medinensis]